mmetsp:Transcript_26583/g.56319  ORF Transcript_26583/g.56319 Transcript_26583/m.56319 type:complete len:263 (+) Transcript_26583:416-1204(+)
MESPPECELVYRCHNRGLSFPKFWCSLRLQPLPFSRASQANRRLCRPLDIAALPSRESGAEICRRESEPDLPMARRMRWMVKRTKRMTSCLSSMSFLAESSFLAAPDTGRLGRGTPRRRSPSSCARSESNTGGICIAAHSAGCKCSSDQTCCRRTRSARCLHQRATELQCASQRRRDQDGTMQNQCPGKGIEPLRSQQDRRGRSSAPSVASLAQPRPSTFGTLQQSCQAARPEPSLVLGSLLEASLSRRRHRDRLPSKVSAR